MEKSMENNTGNNIENKSCCGQIPRFNSLEELNGWAARQFSLDSDNPINEVLEDYLSVKEFLYGVYDLIDRNNKPLNVEGGFMVPIRSAKGELENDNGSAPGVEAGITYETMEMPPAFRAIVYPTSPERPGKVIMNSVPLADQAGAGAGAVPEQLRE